MPREDQQRCAALAAILREGFMGLGLTGQRLTPELAGKLKDAALSRLAIQGQLLENEASEVEP
jgi:hypothetical protein